MTITNMLPIYLNYIHFCIKRSDGRLTPAQVIERIIDEHKDFQMWCAKEGEVDDDPAGFKILPPQLR